MELENFAMPVINSWRFPGLRWWSPPGWDVQINHGLWGCWLVVFFKKSDDHLIVFVATNMKRTRQLFRIIEKRYRFSHLSMLSKHPTSADGSWKISCKDVTLEMWLLCVGVDVLISLRHLFLLSLKNSMCWRLWSVLFFSHSCSSTTDNSKYAGSLQCILAVSSARSRQLMQLNTGGQ